MVELEVVSEYSGDGLEELRSDDEDSWTGEGVRGLLFFDFFVDFLGGAGMGEGERSLAFSGFLDFLVANFSGSSCCAGRATCLLFCFFLGVGSSSPTCFRFLDLWGFKPAFLSGEGLIFDALSCSR